ncbi:hypothetical protein niasHT_004175 [Heterodera trifolii]|uniref:Uncharacterized protein n=1 Tax=Heterodera trifolii TaxID=157864 RepID=A0ABD2LQH1_9BILA
MNFSIAFFMIVLILIGEALAGSLWSKLKTGEASKSRIQSSNAKLTSEIKIKHRSRTQQQVTTMKEGRHNQIFGQTVISNSWTPGSSSNKSGTSAPVVERSRRVSIWRSWTWQ